MTTVAIICEYNPFHSGHEYHINEVRRHFGTDTAIIALMSGNFTQRGSLAIADKTLRAKCAVECGVNLCLELPFPYSVSSAEIFAISAIHILNSIGIVDHLSFGSETGDIEKIAETANIMSSARYEQVLKDMIADPSKIGVGYPALCEAALRASAPSSDHVPLTPNNILAIEYLKALKATGSSIQPHTLKRVGAGFEQDELIDSQYQSATAIRNELGKSNISALEYTPNNAKNILTDAMRNMDMPCSEDSISAAVIASLRLSSPQMSKEIHDVGGGLYNRLRAKSFEANTITDLVRISETKKYTSSRIRRSLWYSYFGVTSSEIKEPPAYSAMLATDGIGRELLKKIKRCSDFPIITKPSATDQLPHRAQLQKTFSDRADSIFQLTKPKPPSGNYALTATPYVKKGS